MKARNTYSGRDAMITSWSNRQAVGLNEHIRSTETNPSLALAFAIQLSPTIAPKQHINKLP